MSEANFFRQQAQQCRKQASQADAYGDRRALRQLAEHYEREAIKSQAGGPKPVH